jgi:hypothetical protein
VKEPNRPAPHGDVLGIVRRLVHQHRVLLERISSAEELGDSIAFELVRLLQGLEVNPAVLPAQAFERALALAGNRARGLTGGDLLKRTAASGARSLQLTPKGDGSFNTRIDDGPVFALPPALAGLLGVLALDRGPSEDGLVGWKALDEIASALEAQTGKRPGRHAITQQVLRLRQAIVARGGANPFLVQTSRLRGARFARRR